MTMIVRSTLKSLFICLVVVSGHPRLFSQDANYSVTPDVIYGHKDGMALTYDVFTPTDLAPYVNPKSPRREQFPALKFAPSQADKYSPLKHVTSDDAPKLLVHGDQDELVPIWHSQKIDSAFEKANVAHEMITIQGAAHGFNAEGNQRTMEAMLRWFNEHLNDQGQSSGR